MSPKIPFLRPNLVPKEAYLPFLAEIDASRFYSNYGPLNQRLEAAILQDWFGGSGAVVTVNNATIGLMLAMRQLRRGNGRYALMPSFTFAATPLAAMWAGLEPYFIDVDPRTWCMDEQALARAVADLGSEVGVVVPYATFGIPMDLSGYARLHESGTPVVVDAAASFGAKSPEGWFGRDFPGLLVYSFHATKSFGVGEGGMVYGGDPEQILRLRRAGNFGFSLQRQSEDCGLNSKISEYTAAIALATLEAFPAKLRLRMRIHDWYLEELGRSGLLDRGWTLQAPCGEVPYQFMPLLTPPGVSNQEVIAGLAARGIESRSYFAPACHQQPQFRDCPHAGLAVTDDLASRVLSLPLWEDMERGVVESVVEALAADFRP